MIGQYTMDPYCETNGWLSDWVPNAGSLALEADYFFGTGRMLSASHGGPLVDRKWSSWGLSRAPIPDVRGILWLHAEPTGARAGLGVMSPSPGPV